MRAWWLALACGACAAKPAPAPPPPVPPHGTEPAAAKQAPAGACIPSDLIAPVDGDLPDVLMGPGPTLCIYRGERIDAPERCWRYDPRGRVTAGEARLPAGIGVPGANDTFQVTSADGTRTATVGPERVEILATGSTTPVSHPLVGTEDDDLSATTTAVYFVGDMLFMVDTDAGPHADVLAFGLDGRVIGTVMDELSGGAVSVLDDHRIAFTEPGFTGLVVYDTRTRHKRRYRRQLPDDLPCTRRQVGGYLDDPLFCDEPQDPAVPACCDALDDVLGAYMGIEVAALPDGRFLLVHGRQRLGEVEVFDPASGALTPEAQLLCP